MLGNKSNNTPTDRPPVSTELKCPVMSKDDTVLYSSTTSFVSFGCLEIFPGTESSVPQQSISDATFQQR